MKRAVLAAMLAVSLALPGAVQAASPSWNLVGSYTVAFTCTAGCMEVYVNSMTITSSNDTTGAVVGSGSVNGFPGYDWTLTGTVSGSSVTFDIEWVSPPALLIYNPFILTGSIDGSGVMSGTASDGQGRTFDWVTTAGAAVPLPATYFVVTATSPQTVGAPFSFTVTAKDVNGGTVTGYTGAVHFTSTDVAASLPADYTFVGGDAGVHTFTNGATLNTTGGQTITATDTVTSSITGTSGTITVNAPPKPPSPSPYAVPTITSLSPGAGKVGATVTLTGTSLSYARSVTFNGVPASFSVRTPSLIVATVPAGARTGPVRVTTPFGGATSARSFYVLP
jgi:hypothetical protein